MKKKCEAALDLDEVRRTVRRFIRETGIALCEAETVGAMQEIVRRKFDLPDYMAQEVMNFKVTIEQLFGDNTVSPQALEPYLDSHFNKPCATPKSENMFTTWLS